MHHHTLLYLSVHTALEVLSKKRVVNRKLIANYSSNDERLDETLLSTSRITRRRRVSKQKKMQVATALSPSPSPPDSPIKPPTANLTSSKFLPVLFDEEDLSSLFEDDSKDECVDYESGGIGSDSSE